MTKNGQNLNFWTLVFIVMLISDVFIFMLISDFEKICHHQKNVFSFFIFIKKTL